MSALFFESIEFLFYMYILKKYNKSPNLKRFVIGFITFLVIGTLLSGFYRTESYENTILTKISSESRIMEAKNLKEALRIKKESLNGFTPQELDYLSKLELYSTIKGNQKAVIVVPNTNIGVNLPYDTE